MKDEFSHYLGDPTLANFQILRNKLINSEAFDPYSEEIDSAARLMREERFTEAVDFIRAHLIPNHILSPGAHMTLGYALVQSGEESKGNMEQTIAALLLKGIELTGDGTKASPFHVTRTSDEYDYLSAHELTFKSQALLEFKGRRIDQIKTNEGKTIHFDITDIGEILLRRFEP